MTGTTGFTSVMNQRIESNDSLDDFPTPPWATRALVEIAMQGMGRGVTCLEPAAGRGVMAEVLREYWPFVDTGDIADYGYPLDRVEDYAKGPYHGLYDWVITNPPFKPIIPFWKRAMQEATTGVALFLRANVAEGVERYEKIFQHCPPTRIAFFTERVPLKRLRWDPDGSTATAYAWFIWNKHMKPQPPLWIPPGQRKALTKPDDRQRFASTIYSSEYLALQHDEAMIENADRSFNPDAPILYAFGDLPKMPEMDKISLANVLDRPHPGGDV
jgi:hypothetical protein